MITTESMPKCAKCNELALMVIGNKFFCGECVHKKIQQQKEKAEKFMLEE